jgi:hypothetical protein
MTPEQFREFISQDLAAIAQRHPAYPNDGIRFTHWVLENVFLLSDSEARAANFDGTNDGGLDGFFVDSHEDTVRLVQCKYSPNIEREATESFTTLPTKLRNPQRIAETNPDIYDCSSEFTKCIGNNFGVLMTFVFMGDNRPEYSDNMKNLVRDSLPPDEKDRYFVEVIGINELINRYLARSPFGLTVPPQKILGFSSSNFLEYSSAGVRGIALHVNGQQLAAFGDKPDMFMANFRYSFDLRNKVNNKISETVQNASERSNVWAYNNGITIVCDRFDDPDLVQKTVQIYRPQIVNGCQTVSTLNRPPVHRYAESTSFLVRVIASNDERLKTNIATYTNSQTKVTERTLRSNDPIQKALQHQFKRLNPPHYYDCKEGEWEALPADAKVPFLDAGRNYRKISSTEAAKSFLAFHGKPIQAKSNPKMIWDLGTDGFYANIFPNERIAEELLFPYLLYHEFANHTETILERIGDAAVGENLVIKEYLVHADTTLLALAGYIIKKRYQDPGRAALRDLIARTPTFSLMLFERCNAALKYEVLRAKGEAERIPGQLFKPRNFFLTIEVFNNAKNKIESDMDLMTPADFYRRCGLDA